MYQHDYHYQTQLYIIIIKIMLIFLKQAQLKHQNRIRMNILKYHQGCLNFSQLCSVLVQVFDFQRKNAPRSD